MVWILSCPSHIAITDRSTPDWSRCMAVVWRIVWERCDTCAKRIVLPWQLRSPLESLCHTGSGHRLPRALGNKRLFRRVVCLLEPLSQQSNRLPPKWHRTLFAPFTTDVNRTTGLQMKIADAQGCDLRNPGTGIVHEHQENPVTQPGFCRGIRRIEQSLHLFSRQVSHDCVLESLHGNRQQALCHGQRRVQQTTHTG